ncbi:hypothetical protein CRG98_007148 [Punica granatum]|uniref:Myb/SANT-like domain-containing protein n=1 Tax=Punica granatum TaxID=22663 RepID=A0A2I0KVI9_PUNGR|nr:hypothetical protein CRG98_007148 [Punica granatum]
MDLAFLNVLLEKMRRTHTTTWKTSTWKEITDEMINLFPEKHLCLQKVKDKYQRMKTNFTRFSEIVKHTGVGWDADTNIITADSDVWDMFIKHCIGAIDGTHVDACMPHANRVPYRDRNADISQNVFAACTHDMMFTYVMTGWEGSTHDSRIFADAASLDRFPAPRGRQYYVVDAGFSNIPGYLAPYKGERLFMEYGDVWADYDEFRNPPQQHGIRVDVDAPPSHFNEYAVEEKVSLDSISSQQNSHSGRKNTNPPFLQFVLGARLIKHSQPAYEGYALAKWPGIYSA